MQHGQSFRSALLALSMLSGCAASDFADDDAPGRSSPRPTGAFGAFLSGRYAASRTDLETAADRFLAALSKDPKNPELERQAFLATAMTGRPEASHLARLQPGNPAAQLLLADEDVRAGRWNLAEARYAALPASNVMQVLQPLLVAWAQQGGGHASAALATLRPFVEGQRFRAVYTLHAALIADQAGRTADAAKLYQAAQREYGDLNLRLGVILASWEARQGQVAVAQRLIRDMVAGNAELAIAQPMLEANVAAPSVPDAAAGIAETYLAMAASLRQQGGTEFALLLLRLALDLRPDMTAARLLVSEIQDGSRHPTAALAVLADVPQTDPLIPVVRLRRAQLNEKLGRSEEAQRLLEALARDYPDRPEPLALMAEILRRKSRFVEAAVAYGRAIERIPDPAPSQWLLFYQRGVSLDRAGQWARAEADFDRALQLSPEQPAVLNYLGYSLTEQGRDLPRARRLIERAVQQRPNDGSIVDSLGWVMLRQGDIAGAVRNLERAVELSSEDATINGHLGDALYAAGRKREAEFQWRRALTLKPDPAETERIEARLRGLPDAAPASAAGDAQAGTQADPGARAQ